jgi:hypothetical protein
LKTKFIYTAALVVMAAVMLAVPFRTAGAQSGAATPQELGNKVLEAIKAQNKDALKSLIHPQVVAYIEQNNTGDLDKVLDNLLSLKIPGNTEFVVQPMEEVSEYDKATQTLTFRDNALFFPIPPTDLLVLVTETEIPKKDEKGEETKVKAKVGVMVNTVTQYNKNWYIVLPMKKGTAPAEEKPK